MLAMVKAGLGITLIPEMVVEQAVRQGNVRAISVEPPLVRKNLFRISYERAACLLPLPII